MRNGSVGVYVGQRSNATEKKEGVTSMSQNQAIEYLSLQPVSDGEGGHVPDKYRVCFQRYSIASGSSDVFDELPIEPKAFVEKANALFNKHNVRVKPDYPKKSVIDGDRLAELTGRRRIFYPWYEFATCVYCCIAIEENYGIDVSKILRRELIKPSSWDGILHACAMSVIALHHLCRGHKVEIPFEVSNRNNPNLKIDGIKCEIKAIKDSDWVKDTMNRGKKDQEEFLTTGHGRKHKVAEDVCFDIGEFVRNRGYKGIRQGDLIFADLSLKSLRRLMHSAEGNLPELKKHRIIFFVRDGLECQGFYVDLDPRLWESIRTIDEEYRISIYPPLAGVSE